MDEETILQLSDMSQQLDRRVLALRHQGKEDDVALLMSAMAVTMGALRAVGETMNRINGPSGLGASGD